jgi:hypothetical protein
MSKKLSTVKTHMMPEIVFLISRGYGYDEVARKFKVDREDIAPSIRVWLDHKKRIELRKP